LRTYQHSHRSRAPVGSIVVKLYRSGDNIRGALREVEGSDDDTIFPSEELEPEVVLRLAENKRQGDPKRLVFVELIDGVEWNPDWGNYPSSLN
jgi:hypothetical protein